MRKYNFKRNLVKESLITDNVADPKFIICPLVFDDEGFYIPDSDMAKLPDEYTDLVDDLDDMLLYSDNSDFYSEIQEKQVKVKLYLLLFDSEFEDSLKDFVTSKGFVFVDADDIWYNEDESYGCTVLTDKLTSISIYKDK